MVKVYYNKVSEYKFKNYINVNSKNKMVMKMFEVEYSYRKRF